MGTYIYWELLQVWLGQICKQKLYFLKSFWLLQNKSPKKLLKNNSTTKKKHLNITTKVTKLIL